MNRNTYSAFYSDPHFGHANIIKYCDRPFVDVDEMNNELIKRYNDTVGHDDTVLWLGDCCFRMTPQYFRDILGSLNGKKELVMGNHDFSRNKLVGVGFDAIYPRTTETIIDDFVCQCCHFPYDPTPGWETPVDKYASRRPKRNPGITLIHGHTHSPARISSNGIHVGVDAWDFRPAQTDEVRALLQNVQAV